ncbi:MAG: type II toxin-antitoxin system RelE family toxin [Pseudonocardiaceae bacterium]
MTEPYRLRVTASAGRTIQNKLSEAVAAVVEFITGTLLDNPHRVGKALHNERQWLFSSPLAEVDAALRTAVTGAGARAR